MAELNILEIAELREIKKSLLNIKGNLNKVISGFSDLEKNPRLATNQIVFGLFDTIDELSTTEVKIYGFLKGKQD